MLLMGILLVGCNAPGDAPKRDATPTSVERSQRCLDPNQRAILERPPVSADSAKRLAKHYGACIYDAQQSINWLRVAADLNDPEAMEDLATLLEGTSARTDPEVEALRRRATDLDRSP